MAEHRVSMLGSRCAATTTRPARAIRGSAPSSRPAPPADRTRRRRAQFRAELRAQLVAIAPRIVAESTGRAPPHVPRPAAPGRAGAESRRPAPDALAGCAVPLGRPLAVAASAGRRLRAAARRRRLDEPARRCPATPSTASSAPSESVQLAIAGSDHREGARLPRLRRHPGRRGRRRCCRAPPRAPGAGPHGRRRVSTHTAEPDHAHAGLGRLATCRRRRPAARRTQAVRNSSAAPLAAMTTWAPGQLTRLHAHRRGHAGRRAARPRRQPRPQLVAAALHPRRAARARASTAPA